jgi:microcystin-dependent protein
MATTTNYAWETPDDTDLVKDGAAAIRTLGSSVDTTTKALNPSTTLGDVEYRSSTANTNTRLPIGTSGQVLTVTGGVPAWAAPAGTITGTVIFYAKNTAPTGFLKANGAAVSRTTYADLFATIGTTFGAGDGSTTFLLPDLRGYFPRGWADNGSIDSGRSFGSTQAATTLTANPLTDGPRAQENVVANSDGTDGTVSISVNSAASTTEATATRQKFRPVNIALLACIKF